MFIGTCQVDIHLPESSSLKKKRQLLKRIKDRVRNQFNVSIAEVGNNELWQRATLGISVVSNDRRYANQVLNQVVEHIGQENGILILDFSLEIF